MKIKKNIPLIDQHNKNGFWGGKFGGNFIPETLKKPVEDLEILFSKSETYESTEEIHVVSNLTYFHSFPTMLVPDNNTILNVFKF